MILKHCEIKHYVYLNSVSGKLIHETWEKLVNDNLEFIIHIGAFINVWCKE